MAFSRRIFPLFAVVTFLVLFLHFGLEFHAVALDIARSISGPKFLATKLGDLLFKPKLTPFVRRIVAVGDLHGDMTNARRVLQFSGVVDENDDWTGNVDFFVQTGDIIDR